MRNIRALTMIFVALLAGLSAAFLSVRWLARQTSVSVSQVAVANVELGIGQPISADNVKLVDWPAGSIPEGAFSDPGLLDARVAKMGILRGEPIVEAKLAVKGTKGGLSAVIAAGKRAITVRVNDVVGVAGFALPGNYVDVIVNTTADQSTDKEHSVSKIVLERILVLAVAQEASRDDTKPKVVNAVTLEVSPHEAEIIDLARSVGALSLVLRNQTESIAKNTNGAGVTKQVLLGISPPRPVVAPAAVVKTRVVRAERAPTAPARQREPKPVLKRWLAQTVTLECFKRTGG